METQETGPRRMRDVVRGKRAKAREGLFDAFWREGELALLFGEPDSGKSVLSIQIADALARGRALQIQNSKVKSRNGSGKRRKVLYVDLVLSERQFRERYPTYKFAAELYRDVPWEGEDVYEFVARRVKEHSFDAVIIDDLSMVSRVADGTEEALRLMYRLRRLAVETGVSILVLADSYPFVYANGSPERGLRRARVLCGVADSAFALYEGTVVQTRSRSGEKVWTESDGLGYHITELENGMLGMEFDASTLSEERREMICDIKRMHDEDGMTFREIAAELEVSKSQAGRLYRLWNESLERTMDNGQWTIQKTKPSEPELEFWQEDEVDPNVDYDRLYEDHPEMEEKRHLLTLELLAKYRHDPEVPLVTEDDWEPDVDESGESGETDRELIDEGEWTVDNGQCTTEEQCIVDNGQCTIEGQCIVDNAKCAIGESEAFDSLDSPDSPDSATLERSVDGYGEEIFVEKWMPNVGKPAIWYKRERQGFRRMERDTFGISVTRVGTVLGLSP